MTPKEYAVLNRLCYEDFGFDGTDTSGTLQDICQRIVQEKGDAAGEAVQAVARGEYPGLSKLTYAGGQNNNDSSGMVAYAYSDGDNVICSFRGSEGDMISNVDWKDDYYAGLQGQSLQYTEALAFAQEMSKGKNLVVTGHSKGGNIAMYVASKQGDCTGITFNAQGFPPGYLTEGDIRRLRESGLINYVTDNDLVGSLLEHYENRKYAEGVSQNDIRFDKNHTLENMKFDASGNPIPSKQSNVTKNIERASIRLASHFAIATQDEILVPRGEMLQSISSFKKAQTHLQGSYRNMEKAMDHLNSVWKGLAYNALLYQWKSIYGNISKAEERMVDAINELQLTHDLFDHNE